MNYSRGAYQDSPLGRVLSGRQGVQNTNQLQRDGAYWTRSSLRYVIKLNHQIRIN